MEILGFLFVCWIVFMLVGGSLISKSNSNAHRLNDDRRHLRDLANHSWVEHGRENGFTAGEFKND
jgi:hypothetical protein